MNINVRMRATQYTIQYNPTYNAIQCRISVECLVVVVAYSIYSTDEETNRLMLPTAGLRDENKPRQGRDKTETRL